MRGLPWREQCRIIAAAGFTGVEIAPFSLVTASVAELDAAARGEMVQVMSDAGLSCAGLHWLLAPPPPGLHFTTSDDAVRSRTIDYLRQMINFCGDLGGSVMVFGSPKQRGAEAVGISVEDAKARFADGLAQVAEQAQARGVHILIESLDRSQTDVVNTQAEAMELVDRIAHPAIQTMFDFHNTPDENEPFEVLIKRYYDHIFHVHVQEMDGRHLGTGDGAEKFVASFQTLKNLNYERWISLEVFDFAPGGETIAQESMRVLKQIEAQLT